MKRSKKDKHTPTPWEVPQGWEGHIFKDGSLIGKMTDCRTSTAKDNAAFIVRAVNAHEELLTAVKKLHHTFGSIHEGSERCEFCKAIAKAEGR